MPLTRPITLDLLSVLGPGPAAIGRRALLAEVGAAQAALTRVRGWADARRAVAKDAQAAVAIAEASERGRNGAPLVVCGLPASVRAATVAARILAPDAPIRTLSGPDADRVASLRGAGAAWLVLEGAPWTDAVAEWAVAQGETVAVAGEGSHEPPPGGWWIPDDTAGDGRWSASGATAQFVAAWCGADASGLRAGAASAATSHAAPFLENPAAVLAVIGTRGAELLGTSGLVSVNVHPALAPLAAWFAAAWHGSTARASAAAGSAMATGPASFGQVDDELLLEALIAGARDRLCVAWDAPMSSVLPDGSALSGSATARAFVDLCARASVPRIAAVLPGLDATSIGAALAFAEHVCALASALRGHAPVERTALGAWRDALARTTAADGVDEDGTTA